MVKKNTADVIGDDVIRLIGKHWWKVVLIIIAFGIAVTGFKCNFGKLSVEKESVIKVEKQAE